MTTLYLKYGSYVDGVLTWEMYGQSFVPLEFYEIDQTTTESGRLLSEIEYEHIKSTRGTWKLKISANELTNSTKYAYLKNCFKAAAVEFSTDNWSHSTTVVFDKRGDFPVTFINNHKSLPSVSFTLIQKEP
jgi:hypothetical protein